MVRETRHLWVGNLPENIREERIREHFKRYGRVQNIKLLPANRKEEASESSMACTVAFMDIKSASKAHTADHKLDDRTLTTEYYEPTAIPSAASPQTNASTAYSTSPGSTRFPNSHSSSEEHGNFPDRFYDRGSSGSGNINRVADGGDYLRRSSSSYLQDTSRGRNRDRLYRNGPYAAIIDRGHRASWSYEGNTRYNNQSADPSYTPAAAETSSSTKKKPKSRSGSRSPSPAGSTSSRSPSRSRSRSSSSSSSSSTSRGSSSRTSSPKSRRVQSSISTPHAPVVHSEDRRPLAICVRNLPARSSDTSLKDGLFHEYKKHGKVTWVKVVGQSSDRYAIVCFKKPDDVEKALEVSYDKLFFGCKIEVAPYQGYDVEDNEFRPYEAELDEFHPKATRTLFIGNLEKDVTASDLRKHFDQFGEIIEIDIKKQGAVSSYAFCQYSDIVSVVKAMRTMDGEHLGNNRIKLGFGKSMPTNCVWIDGVAESVNEKYLTLQFDPFGAITQVDIDRERGHALIFYEQVLCAQTAVKEMRGFNLRGRKIQVDFASRECQESFYEHLQKQGHVTERPGFEERRDSACKNVETATISTANRFSKYDTPTRPRTASYSSRSGSQSATAAIPSPGTPGSATPRGTSSRSRISRYEYYDSGDYPTERRFRNYDEFSQGSAASHEDVYDHEYGYARDSPSHVDGENSRVLPSVVVSAEHVPTPFAPPDIRHLQKERVHLLEQLEECPSSGDELSPKKRLKLELLNGNITSDVPESTRNDHRKILEVRRLSESSVKHHSRRPSVDGSKHIRDLVPDRANYMPHAVCKRRKTAGSDGGTRLHHHELSGSESVGSSRPGTPLCDERPEHFTPSEPRRIPREREGPLSLPLPRFAAQVIGKGLNISIAGFKNQAANKESVASSPPAAATSPRIPNPVPPSPVHVPPPASPPPRPPSLSSNSSDSDGAPPSPSLEERIRSLDEKYEKWSGSRALSAAGGDALAKLDASAAERFRFRHKLLDLDLKEVQPSEIVKSVMAKRSVFDEDSKRLENVGEKYEPKEFNLYPRPVVVATAQPQTPPPVAAKAPVPVHQLPKTPTALSPRSTTAAAAAAAATTSGSPSIVPAKGLQYPFPSHPPSQPPSSSTSTRITPGSTPHGDSRLKPCASVPPTSDRTNSKVNVNRIGGVCPTVVPNNNVVGQQQTTTTTTTTAAATGSGAKQPNNNNNNNNNINKSDSLSSSNIPVVVANLITSSCESEPLVNKTPPRSARTGSKDSSSSTDKSNSSSSSSSGDNNNKPSRRDSASSLSSSSSTNSNNKHERKESRDSESECDTRKSEICDKKAAAAAAEAAAAAAAEIRRREQEERERKEKEEQQQQQQQQQQRLEKEKAEKERLEKERQERERSERERKQERERKEREERERREREEQLEKERLREKREKDERERREREEKERREREEQAEKERLDKERLEKLEKERHERKRDKEEEKLERKHKEDNHDRRNKDKDEIRHRDSHSETNKKDRDDSGDLKTSGKQQNHVDCIKVDKHRDSHGESNRNAKEITKDHDQQVRTTKDGGSNHESTRISELSRKDSHDSRNSTDVVVVKNNHENRREEKSSRHGDSERRKDNSTKENRDNNQHDKNRHFSTESRENSKDRHSSIDSRHMSTDSEKSRPYGGENKSDGIRRKDKTTSSSSATLGTKRRMSSQEEPSEEAKRLKLSSEHRKLSERRDSKDSRSSDKTKPNKHAKNNITKILEDKVKDEKQRMSDDKIRKDKERDRDKEERYKNKQKSDKQKIKTKSKDVVKENRESPTSVKTGGVPSVKDQSLDNKDFLAKLELRATEEVEKHRTLQRKEAKEKRKQEVQQQHHHQQPQQQQQQQQEQQQQHHHHHQEQHQSQQPQHQMQQPQHQMQQQHMSQQQSQDDERNKYNDEQRKKEKRASSERRSRDESTTPKSTDERSKKKERIRKFTNSSDTTDSDEPKKHSIFDIVDDEPAYISMYDKVKARSCKNMQKQEEEKRQEKIKAKFSQLKQSRAKREEKKRSTSWDEDSDSDQCDRSDNKDHDHMNSKARRGVKMLITSSSEDEQGVRKPHKNKQDIYSDSDFERIGIGKMGIDKHDMINSSDEENSRTKSKSSKSRIQSESSDDEHHNRKIKYNNKIKTEILSDGEIHNDYSECDEKSFKNNKDDFMSQMFEDKYIKKEKKMSKHHAVAIEDIMNKTSSDVKTEIFTDMEVKIPKLENTRYNHKMSSLCDISSEGENQENKKGFLSEKSESRKKHKRKQKRQKSLLLDEVNIQDKEEFDTSISHEQCNEKVKNMEKKKHSSKKDKKRDKFKDEERMKIKKAKKLNKADFGSKTDLATSKRDEKMEDIFGPLSDDSDNEVVAVKEQIQINNHSHNKHNNSYIDDLQYSNEKLQVAFIYGSDSDSLIHSVDVNKERIAKEEHRKRKEKKRKEKERRLREENENSVDFADLGKVLEANLKEESLDVPEQTEVVHETVVTEDIKPEVNVDTFRFNDVDNSNEIEKDVVDKREIKEKKKKRKKSKEEKQNRHHHHHHDRNQEKSEKSKAPEFVKKEPNYLEELKNEVDSKPSQQSPSLPSLLDIPSPPNNNKASPNVDYAISPITRDPMVSPIPKTPTSGKEKKRDKFIPGFGAEVDEQIHENAVKSIPDFESSVKEEAAEIKTEVVPKLEKPESVAEEKPRGAISQEETEVAVAAILGESYSLSKFSDCYSESQNSPTNNGGAASATAAEDDEEMRQAVQSLSASDLDAKPDTPQSEHDLQIDTDTEEQEELGGLRYDQPPRTPDMVDLSQPPKTPDLPASYYRAEEQNQNKSSFVMKSLEPPMLTPINQSIPVLRKPRLGEEPSPVTTTSSSSSLVTTSVPEPTRSVISQPWGIDAYNGPPRLVIDAAKQDTVAKSQEHPRAKAEEVAVIYSTPPAVKITEPPDAYKNAPSTASPPKREPAETPSKLSPKLQPITTIPTTSALSSKIVTPMSHLNVPIRMQHAHLPMQAPKQQTSTNFISSPGLLAPLTSISQSSLNRLPITSVMAPRPLQPSTTFMPQAKTAHVSKIPTASEPPRMVYHTTSSLTVPLTLPMYTTASYQQRLGQPMSRDVPPPDLLVPSRHVLPPTSYATLFNDMAFMKTHPSVIEKSMRPLPPLITEPPKLVPTSSYQSSQPPSSSPVSGNSNKLNLPVIQETKLLSPTPDRRSPQTCVIQQTSVLKPTSYAHSSPKPQESNQEPINTVAADVPKIKIDAPRTSTPSPVIVCAAKELAPVSPLVVKQEIPSSQTDTAEEKPSLLDVKPPEKTTIAAEEVKEVESKTHVVKTELAPSPIPSAPALIKEEESPASNKKEVDSVSVIKETSDRYDDDKHEDTESVVSDISKERLSAEILSSKDDPMDSKEDSDYWSAKEVNIDSVIKKVDALCSADELSEGSSEMGKDEWFDSETKSENCIKADDGSDKISDKDDFTDIQKSDCETENIDEGVENFPEEKESGARGGRRGGRRIRGSKNRAAKLGVTTRRGKTVKEGTSVRRGGRNNRGSKERKTRQSESEAFGDVYEFRDDSDENKDRPRLILTIKSPQSNVPNVQPTVVKEVVAPQKPTPQPPPVAAPPVPEQTREEFVSPASNTRKSRRLQERDGSRNTVDDIIEDVVRNVAVVTRSAAAAAAQAQGVQTPGAGAMTRRSARQNVTPAATKSIAETRKSPRGGPRRKDRRASETAEDSSEESKQIKKAEDGIKHDTETVHNEPPPSPAKDVPLITTTTLPPKADKVEQPPQVKEKPHEGLKVTVLRRVKVEMSEEPTSLIDPVTGLLTPMRECEEGKYIPVANSAGKLQPGVLLQHQQHAPGVPEPIVDNKLPEPVRVPTSTALVAPQTEATKQPATVIANPQPSVLVQQSHKVPQSRKAHVLQAQAKALANQQPLLPQVVTVQPMSQQQQNQFINKTPNIPVSQSLNVNVTNFDQARPKQQVHNLPQPPMSPVNNTKQHIVQPQQQQQQQQHQVLIPKQHILNAAVNNSMIVNANMGHLKPPLCAVGQIKQHMNRGPPIAKQHALMPQQQQILTGSVASPPLKQSHHLQSQQPVVTGASSNRLPSAPISGGKGAMEPPKVEVSMAGCALVPHPSASPQARAHVLQPGMPVPAYEASLGEAMVHFPPGPMRGTHELSPAHYIHTQQVMYQRYYRQTMVMSRSQMMPGGLENPGDGQEGEEAPVSSPPLELRRPGSVGLTLSGRPNVVPHGLHSPLDRTADSTQVGPIYNMHNARLSHYHPGRYYDQSNEPPPAHRPLTSHATVPMGPINRPLTGHPSLGAAGNLLGQVGRHVAAVAPASQRGLRAATPPHASQVPPQTESLLMLLKQYPCMWQGRLALKNDQAAVQMYFVCGNESVAKLSLPKFADGSTPPLRIFQRMRLEPPQVEGVARKMQIEHEHCMLLALPCGHDHKDVLQQSYNLTNGFITYLQKKQAAGIVNVAAPGTTQPPAYVVHIFPSCDFVNESLRRIAPSLLERVADVAHLLIVITTV